MNADIIEHFHRTEEGAVRRAYIPTHHYSDGNLCPISQKPYPDTEIEEFEHKLNVAYQTDVAAHTKVALSKKKTIDNRVLYASLFSGLIGFILMVNKWV